MGKLIRDVVDLCYKGNVIRSYMYIQAIICKVNVIAGLEISAFRLSGTTKSQDGQPILL